VVALAAALQGGLVARPLGLIASVGMCAGAALCAGDIAARAFLEHRLFPMAAPTGGFVLIASWLFVAAAAIVTMTRQ
jgi:uncharacterized membrane protein YgdD (TMEM256/DUF423 family)